MSLLYSNGCACRNHPPCKRAHTHTRTHAHKLIAHILCCRSYNSCWEHRCPWQYRASPHVPHIAGAGVYIDKINHNTYMTRLHYLPPHHTQPHHRHHRHHRHPLPSTKNAPVNHPGPWVNWDVNGWNGDYTLDYNYEATFYGVYGSNHPELTSTYFNAVVAGMDGARAGARSRAVARNLTGCKPTALHYNAHIGPYGSGDFDEEWEAKPTSNIYLPATNLLEDTDRYGSLLIYASADVHSTDDVITFQRWMWDRQWNGTEPVKNQHPLSIENLLDGTDGMLL